MRELEEETEQNDTSDDVKCKSDECNGDSDDRTKHLEELSSNSEHNDKSEELRDCNSDLRNGVPKTETGWDKEFDMHHNGGNQEELLCSEDSCDDDSETNHTADHSESASTDISLHLPARNITNNTICCEHPCTELPSTKKNGYAKHVSFDTVDTIIESGNTDNISEPNSISKDQPNSNFVCSFDEIKLEKQSQDIDSNTTLPVKKDKYELPEYEQKRPATSPRTSINKSLMHPRPQSAGPVYHTYLYLKQPAMLAPERLLTEEQLDQVRKKIPPVTDFLTPEQLVDSADRLAPEKHHDILRLTQRPQTAGPCMESPRLQQSICPRTVPAFDHLPSDFFRLKEEEDLDEDWDGVKFNAKYTYSRPLREKLEELKGKFATRRVQVSTRTLTPTVPWDSNFLRSHESMYSEPCEEDIRSHNGYSHFRSHSADSDHNAESVQSILTSRKEKRVQFDLAANQHATYSTAPIKLSVPQFQLNISVYQPPHRRAGSPHQHQHHPAGSQGTSSSYQTGSQHHSSTRQTGSPRQRRKTNSQYAVPPSTNFYHNSQRKSSVTPASDINVSRYKFVAKPVPKSIKVSSQQTASRTQKTMMGTRSILRK